MLRRPRHPYTRALLDSVPRITMRAAQERVSPAPALLLEVEDVSKSYAVRRGLFARAGRVDALRNVSMTLSAGETLAVVGESGSGKTTLSRCLVGLLRPTTGRDRVAGEIADRILVMQAGRVVEAGSPAAIFSRPQAPYTRQLIASIPGGGEAGLAMASVVPA